MKPLLVGMQIDKSYQSYQLKMLSPSTILLGIRLFS